jgi:hypothetical protein
VVGAAAAAGVHGLWKPALPVPQLAALAAVLVAGTVAVRREVPADR